MKQLDWFRMYHEARNDRKLRTLSDAHHRIWFNLLCYSAEQPVRGLIDGKEWDVLALEVSEGDVDILREVLDRLERLRICTVTPCNADMGVTRVSNVTVCFIHFEDRNYDKPSDKPEAVKVRVQRHRELKSAGETPGNAVKRGETRVTPRGEDNTDSPPTPKGAGKSTPTHKPKAPELTEAQERAFKQWWELYPLNRRVKRAECVKTWALLNVDKELWGIMRRALEAQIESDDWQREGGQYVPQAATYLHQRRWEDVDVPDRTPLNGTGQTTLAADMASTYVGGGANA